MTGIATGSALDNFESNFSVVLGGSEILNLAIFCKYLLINLLIYTHKQF